VITIAGVDSEGCDFSLTVAVDNPCDAFTITGMSVTNQKTGRDTYKNFSIVGTNPNCSFVTYEWIYDDNLLTKIGDIAGGAQSSINLKLNPDVRSYPSQIPVKVRVTDCNNCVLEQTGYYQLDTYYAKDIMVDLVLNSLTGEYESGNVQIPGVLGGGATPLYDTFQPTLPGEFEYTLTDPVTGKVKFTTPAGTDPGLHVGIYTYQVDNGTWAYNGNIKLNVIASERCKDLVTGDKTLTVSSTYSAGDVYNIPISSEIILASGEEIDWDTWQLITPPTSNSPSITLTTLGNGEKAIAYTVPTPKADDSFAWTVATANGR
jgi:hypothetical protein